MKWVRNLAALGIVLACSTLASGQTQQSTQWQATQTFLQNMQNQINTLRGQQGPSVQPGAAGQFAGYNSNGTVISPMDNPVTPGAPGQYAGYTSGTTIGPMPNPASNYTGPVSIKGNQQNGADQINSVSVNGVINVQTYGADPTGINDSTSAFNQAISTACPRDTNGVGWCNRAVYVPAGRYYVTQINASNLWYFKLFGDSPLGAYAALECTEPTNNTGICTDFTGDQYSIVDDIRWEATSSGHAPQALVLMAKSTISNYGNSQEHDWRSDGFFQSGGDWGVYNFGGEIWDCRMCNWNGLPNKGSLMLSLVNTPGIASPFATVSVPPNVSETAITLDDSSYSTQNASSPIVLDSGGYSLDTLNISGYCNTGLQGTGTPCITDYASVDTGGVMNLTIDKLRHETFGSTPGPLINMKYGSVWGANIKATWNPGAPTSGPAANFSNLLNWSDINIFIYPSNETGAPVTCSGGNKLGDIIHVQYGAPGPVYLPNGCLGATIIDGVEGSGGGTLIRNWLYQSQVTALANFAACNSGMEGSFGRANNCSTAALNTTCSGTGSVHAEVMCNGTSWVSLGY